MADIEQTVPDYEDSLLEQKIKTPRGWVKFSHSKPPGLLVTSESAKTCGWDNFDLPPDQMDSLNTAKGLKIPCRIFTNPALCVVATSPYFRQTPYSSGPGSKRIDGLWDPEKDKKNGYKCVKKLAVIFLDSENRMLHSKPLSLKIEGMFGFKFFKQYEDFCKEMFGNEAVHDPKKAGNPKYREWMKEGKDNGPKEETAQFYASTFVFRPKFELKHDVNPGGRPNAMATCCTMGFQPASVDALVSGRHVSGKDYEKIQALFKDSRTFFDLQPPALEESPGDGNVDAIVVSGMDDDGFEKF